jgi:hypothetical protein
MSYVQKPWLDDMNGHIAQWRSKHKARVVESLNMFKLQRKGVYIKEECDEFQEKLHKTMKPWKTKSSELNLMALEYIYNILPKERSSVTRQLREQMCKEPIRLVGTINGKYRLAKAHGCLAPGPWVKNVNYNLVLYAID